MLDRLCILKTILWAFVGLLVAVTAVRVIHGLGAVTNLSDAAPWGLWVGFDVMAGVALAAGGFVMAAAVYIFHLDAYKSFARPAILTAFLGYLAVAIGLLYDLGLPWHIWHPLVNWQYHSVLFEVAMCVMLYLTVLSLEFAPVVLEHSLFDRPAFRRILAILKRVTIPLVIAGIVLSTLHQSSLGSLFLITPGQLHPLWYSPIIYVLFFVSAVALGLMTVVLESLLAAFFLGHKLHMRLLSNLGLAASVVLGLYAVLRVGDLAVRGVLSSCWDGSWQGFLFLFELAISAVIPALLLLMRSVRGRVWGLAACSSLTVCGLVLHRIDVCIIAFARPEGSSYFPGWMEFAVSLGIVSAGLLIFIFFAQRFRVYDDVSHAAQARPSYDPATLHGLLPVDMAAPRRYSLAAIGAAAVAVALLPLHGAQPARTPVTPVRMIEGSSVPRGHDDDRRLLLADTVSTDADGAARRVLLVIDGNRDDTLVLFDHAAHSERMGGDASCAVCHHLDLPLDLSTSCHECHRDMYESTWLFDHSSHVAKLGGNGSCSDCHRDNEEVKSFETATACAECHEEPAASEPIVASPGARWPAAPSYVDAMHGLCIACHRTQVEQAPEAHPAMLDRCDQCHDADRSLDFGVMTHRRMTRGRTSDHDESATAQ